MKIPSRDIYKKYNKMRKNPSKYVPHHFSYCYGPVDGVGYTSCPFIQDWNDVNSYQMLYAKSLYNKGKVILEEVGDRCSLTGHFVFDRCKHCGINEKCKLDKNGDQIW